MPNINKFESIRSVLAAKPDRDSFGRDITGANNAVMRKEVALEGEARMVDKKKRSLMKKAIKGALKK
jgi:hypothetical protein